MHEHFEPGLPFKLNFPFPDIPIRLLQCRALENFSWPEDKEFSNPHWRLHWNQTSEGRFILDGEEIIMEPRYIYLISPNTAFKRCSAHPVSHFYIHFLVGGEYESVIPGIYAVEADEGQLLPLFRWAAQKRKKKIESISSSIMARLLSLTFDALSEIPPDSFGKPVSDARIRLALRFLEEHLSEPCSNEALAHHAAMGVRSFIATFKANTGKTPHQHLIEKRLDKAAILLQFTDATIEEIADECGFNDRNYLTRLFFRRYRIPPAAFRKHQF